MWGWDIRSQPWVTAGALGQGAATDTRDQLGDRAGGTEVVLDPVSGSARTVLPCLCHTELSWLSPTR